MKTPTKFFGALVVVMLALVAIPAQAGEVFLGSIVSAAGADTTNGTTAAPFVIAQAGTRLTIQCTATAYIAVDDLTAVTASRGVTVAADALFLTKVDMPTRAGIPQKIIIGTTTSAVVRIAGPAAVTCDVWSRRGDE